MMKIWRYVSIILLILLCGMVTAQEVVLTTSGGSIPGTSIGNISFSAPVGALSGIEILAVSDNPDQYTIANAVTVDTAGFDLSSESCGGTEKQITYGGLNHVSPKVSDGKVVYEEWSAGVASIGMYDIATGGIYPVYPGMQQQTNPDISGRIIVYEQVGSNNRITNVYAYDIQTQTATQIAPSTSNQNQPVVSGRYVAWQDWRSGNSDIYMADLNSGTTQAVTKDLHEQKKPDISGSFIIWEDWRNGNADVYLYDIIEQKEYRLTSHSSDQTNPRISGNIVVWEDNRNGVSDIYAMTLNNFQEYRLTEGLGKAVNPDISGPLVVWEDWRNGNADIYLLDLITGYIYQVTTNQADQKKPSIFGSNLVWEDYRGGNSNIFLYTFSSSTTTNYSLYGSASMCGSPAPVGTVVTAFIDGVARASFTIQQSGQYGSASGPYLTIPVFSSDFGKTLTFRLNDYSVDQGLIVGAGGVQRFDLVASCVPPVQNYVLSGNVLVNNQAAPVGTLISASVNNQVRGQVTVSSQGQYSGLTIPVNQADIGQQIIFTATTGGYSYQAAQTITAGQQVGTWFDLTFGSTTPGTSYTFSGSALIEGQLAPSGTIISAMIDNQVRGRVTVTTSGQYSGLMVPVYESDYGKYLSFTATWNGVTYTAAEQVILQTQQGEIIIASADISTESSQSVSKRLDLNFSLSATSKYSFWGRANLDGSPLPAGNTIYAVIDNQVRGQITTHLSGSYGTENGPYLEVPVTQADIGKTIRFQTSAGAEGDQSQLIVTALKLQKNINFISKPSTTADFTATPTSGALPLSVRFTDRSSGSPKSWFWDFGDGSTATQRSPTHVYTKSGVYSVGLMVTYWNGQTQTAVKQNLITAGIVTPPEAQIGLNPGWNFMSVPKMLADGQNTARALFGHLDVGGHSIFTYNPRSKTWTTVGATTTINPLDAVWVYSTKSDIVNLYFAGDALQIPPTKRMVKGWNTFGVTSMADVPAQNALLSVKDQWVYVIGFDSKAQRYQGTIMNVPEGQRALLHPGYGYWIYMNEEGDLAAIGI